MGKTNLTPQQQADQLATSLNQGERLSTKDVGIVKTFANDGLEEFGEVGGDEITKVGWLRRNPQCARILREACMSDDDRFQEIKEKVCKRITDVEVDRQDVLDALPQDELPTENELKATELLLKLSGSEFIYEGGAASVEEGLLAGIGDCSTLVKMYMALTKSAGITAREHTWNERRLVDSGPINGRSVNFNVDPNSDELYWTFKEHQWLSVDGKDYDVLFMKKGCQPSYPASNTAGSKFKDVTYFHFDVNGNARYLILPDQNGKLINPGSRISGEGIVFTSTDSLRAFIG